MALVKAYILVKETREKIELQFNPTTFKFGVGVETVGVDKSKANETYSKEITGFKASDVNVNVLLDGTTKGSKLPKTTVEKLFKLVELTKKSKTGKSKIAATLPLVEFWWGKLLFTGYLANVEVEYTLFAPDGTALRANVDLKFSVEKRKKAKTNPTSGTPKPGSIHQLQSGQFLDTVSHELYGDPNRWRAIAEANNIDDPLALRVGGNLLIPDLEE
jgi:hypothetical protein